ncbi:MAG: DUF996 domain-containing protein [bacterium]
MGGIGAILLLIFPLVGFILILIAVKQLADAIKREDIFRDFLLCVIFSSVSFVVIFVMFFIWVCFIISTSPPSTLQPLSTFPPTTSISPVESQIFSPYSPSTPQPPSTFPPTPTSPPEEELIFFLFFLIVYPVFWAVNSVASYFAQKGFLALANITGEQNFSTAGKLIFLGALLYIVFLGWVVYLVGIIFAIISFFSLPDIIHLKGKEGYA